MDKDEADLINEVSTLYEAGQPTAALELLTEHMDRRKPDLLLWMGLLTEVVFGADRLAEVAEYYRVASDLGDTIASYNLGVTYQQMGMIDKAEASFLKAKQEGHISAELKLILIILDRGGPSSQEAIEAANEIDLSEDDRIFDEYLIGEIFEKSNGRIDLRAAA
ncbi:hypothetical protein [Oryzibacter oryziterrae]|uniref:hypothetical protein n=1 Tax=Oryzibacter oryziterrae TaxID=2766474 RepID=UPI001F262331|nr:hypothetical protein [Oryzibacter oryziterrae]